MPSADAGRVVGRYQIVREIGRGGMAVVYVARQPDLDRPVALKELSRFHVGSAESLQRFLRESRFAGSLNHPNVVTVYEYFEEDGTPYIAMEYVPRGSLRPYMNRLTLSQIAGVLEGMLAGLAHGEATGIVHRDLKPENIMVTADGRVKITDFGIARATHRAAGEYVTATGVTIGTPSYMAPEQAMGGDIGPWSDLYSLGVMTYELIVGRPPFDRDDAPLVILMRHVNERIPSPTEVRPDVDGALSEWIDSLLVKDPNARVRHAIDAWDSLEEIIVRLLGPLWRRSARLLDDHLATPNVKPLTPAPFESQPSLRTPAPAELATPEAGPTTSTPTSDSELEQFVTFAPAPSTRDRVDPTATSAREPAAVGPEPVAPEPAVIATEPAGPESDPVAVEANPAFVTASPTRPPAVEPVIAEAEAPEVGTPIVVPEPAVTEMEHMPESGAHADSRFVTFSPALPPPTGTPPSGAEHVADPEPRSAASTLDAETTSGDGTPRAVPDLDPAPLASQPSAAEERTAQGDEQRIAPAELTRPPGANKSTEARAAIEPVPSPEAPPRRERRSKERRGVRRRHWMVVAAGIIAIAVATAVVGFTLGNKGQPALSAHVPACVRSFLAGTVLNQTLVLGLSNRYPRASTDERPVGLLLGTGRPVGAVRLVYHLKPTEYVEIQGAIDASTCRAAAVHDLLRPATSTNIVPYDDLRIDLRPKPYYIRPGPENARLMEVDFSNADNL